MIALTLPDLDATDRFAAAVAAELRPGDVLVLEGGIGAGKTTFTSGLARALGALEPVRSPTYTIAHSYQLAQAGTTLAHLDLYRDAATLSERAWGDLEPYFEQATYAVVEWPGAGLAWITDRISWRIEFEIVDAETRLARVAASDRVRGVTLASRLARA